MAGENMRRQKTCESSPHRVLTIRVGEAFKLILTVMALGVVAVFSCWLFFWCSFSHVNGEDASVSHAQLEVRIAASQDPVASFCTISSSSSTSETSAGYTGSSTALPSISTSTGTSVSATPTAIAKVIQLDGPVLGPQGVVMSDGGIVNTTELNGLGETSCQVVLMEFMFKDSFGKPFVGDYTPPPCVRSSNSVIMNLTVLSKGTQFDRLAIMYFGDSEVFRTSTAEPRRSGIVWTYMKDMSHFMYYWKSPQKLIFDLPNQTTANLTGAYNATLTATFFNGPLPVDPADTILPISLRVGQNASQPSVFTLTPATSSTNATTASTIITDFPRNANKAIFSLSSTGQGTEEFWWSNALQSDTLTYNATGGTLFGFSPFREVQLFIDGMMAGVQWPFPVVFTGGVSPSFWSPVVGIDAFDLKEYEIDVTPWLPLLCDGQPHTFSLNVVGLNDDGKGNAELSTNVGSNWKLTGKVFIWLDSPDSITTGTAPSISSSAPSISVSQSITQNATGSNDTLTYTTSIQRKLTVSSQLTTQNGTLAVSWTQVLNHTDQAQFLSFGNIQSNLITTQGSDTSLRGAATSWARSYSYPLAANSTGTLFPNGSTSFIATLSRTKLVNTTGIGAGASPSALQPFAALPESQRLVLTLAGTTYANTQSGNATLFLTPGSGNGSFSFGSTVQEVRFGGKSAQGELGAEPDVELYFRSVGAANGSLRTDVERLNGRGVVRSGVVVGAGGAGGGGAEGMGNGNATVLALGGMGGAEMDVMVVRRQQHQQQQWRR